MQTVANRCSSMRQSTQFARMANLTSNLASNVARYILSGSSELYIQYFLLIENSLMYKSKAGHGEGAMIRVDRKCEAYVQ